jgi:hypothetical protein
VAVLKILLVLAKFLLGLGGARSSRDELTETKEDLSRAKSDLERTTAELKVTKDEVSRVVQASKAGTDAVSGDDAAKRVRRAADPNNRANRKTATASKKR